MLVLSDFAVPWTVAYQASPSMEFSSKNTGMLTISFSRGSSLPGINPRFPTLQADSLPSEPIGTLAINIYFLINTRDALIYLLHKPHLKQYHNSISELEMESPQNAEWKYISCGVLP